MQNVLVELSRRTGQPGAMDWLDFFAASPESLEKTPYLVLVGRGPMHSAMTAGAVQGALLIYEYRFAGQGTKVFATDDVDGLRTVIASPETRANVAQAALRCLMRVGAIAALASLDGGPEGELPAVAAAGMDFQMVARTRTAPRYLPLLSTMEDTLATLGDDTRRNFRRYRNRATAELGAEFVPQVHMELESLLRVNRQSRNPATETAVQWRYGLLERRPSHTGTLFSGLRAADGRWLSLIGGRRHGDTTEIDWQMNLDGLARYSLCTAMRAFLLEHEIARGTRKLIFRGGTPHPMHHYFAQEKTTDILAVRNGSARAWMLRTFSRWIFPEKNFLAAALREMQGEPAEPPRSPSGLADAA